MSDPVRKGDQEKSDKAVSPPNEAKTHWAKCRAQAKELWESIPPAWKCVLFGFSLFLVAVLCLDWWLSGGPQWSFSDTLHNVVLAGVAIVALIFAKQRIKVADEQTKISERDLRNERYQKGAEMLASGAIATRIGGVYALKRLAEEYPDEYHIQIMRVLCSFIRHPPKHDENSDAGDRNSPKMLRGDVQEAIAVIGGRSEEQRELEGKENYRLDLRHSDLMHADLPDAHLERAILIGACFDRANLKGAFLTNALLSQAKFKRTNMTGANLEGARLWLAELSGARMLHAKLKDADMWHAKLIGVRLIGADMSRVNLSEAELQRATMSSSDLTDANLESADLSMAMLEKVNLRRAVMSRANLTGALLTDADLSMTTLIGTILVEAELTRTKFIGADMKGQISTTPSGSNSEESIQVDFTDAVTNDTDFAGAYMDEDILSDEQKKSARNLPEEMASSEEPEREDGPDDDGTVRSSQEGV